jgi:hypothetical protein
MVEGRGMEDAGLGPLCMFGCISVVVVEGALSGIAGGWGYVKLIQ